MDTILVVDDDSDLLLYIQTVLQIKGYQCLTATNGVEAQTLITQRTARISAALVDWMMFPMNGIQLLKWIKKQPGLEHIPVIMQTAMNSPEHIKEGIEAGAFYYLIKPTNHEVLWSIVRAAISDFKYKQELLDRVQEYENPFRLLVEGTFHLRTMDDVEDLALKIANMSPVPEKAVGIVELLANAVEYGSLGMQYDEKTDYIAKGTWRAEIERRLALPEHAGKYVEVRLAREPDRLTLLVTDQGPGFDFEKYLELDPDRVFHNHGRGIAMIKADVDLRYLGRGNQVLVTIPV
ncbi:MAG: response regulator [Candidatus Latescibacteria bacterium]|nr:response regulator [Candidatus Latescibacterota bacterium]